MTDVELKAEDLAYRGKDDIDEALALAIFEGGRLRLVLEKFEGLVREFVVK